MIAMGIMIGTMAIRFGRDLMVSRNLKLASHLRHFLIWVTLFSGLVSLSVTVSPAETRASDGINLDDPIKKEFAMKLVSSAENSSTDWRKQFTYIEDIKDFRGYTAGIIGFTTGTSDLLEIVERYSEQFPTNGLHKYIPALRNVNGSDSHLGLDPGFIAAWKKESAKPEFQAAQERERDEVYFNPSVTLGKEDGLRALGQFIYYDAAVVHGFEGMKGVRARAAIKAKPPAQGGSETKYLNAFLDERVKEMKKEKAHTDMSRIENAQRVFLRNGNLDLLAPLSWSVYGDHFHIK
jgi:chitosanase